MMHQPIYVCLTCLIVSGFLVLTALSATVRRTLPPRWLSGTKMSRTSAIYFAITIAVLGVAGQFGSLLLFGLFAALVFLSGFLERRDSRAMEVRESEKDVEEKGM
jgi:hypothetical protein